MERKKLFDMSIYEDGTVDVAEFKETGAVLPFSTSLASFLDIIGESKIVRTSHLDLALIPKSFLSGRFYSQDTYVVAQFVDATSFDIQFLDDTYSVHFPDLLFIWMVDAGVVSKSSVYALKKTKSSYDVYDYPFGNVYASGLICWGSNSLDHVESLDSLCRYYMYFLASPNNNDLYDTGHEKTTPPLRDAFRSCTEQFNDGLLVESKGELFNFINTKLF